MTRARKAATVGVALALLVVGGLAAHLRRAEPTSSGVPVFVVARGPFRHEVVAEGHLKAVKATPLLAPGSNLSLKVSWLLDDGTHVKKGEPVVRFDPSRVEKDLLDGRAERETAEGRIDKEKAESRALITNLERDQAQFRRELDSAQTLANHDPELFSRNEIIESELDVELATRREDRAARSRDVRQKLSSTSLDLQLIERRKAETKIGRAVTEKASLEVLAPHDGIVVFSRDWRGELPQVGQTVFSGFTIGELPDLSEMEAEVYVLEADAGGLAVGKKAEVQLESRPGEVFKATVKRVDAVPKQRVKGVPVQYFGATLTLAKTDPAIMKPGQRVAARLTLIEENDVLSVPRPAVVERNGKRVVYVRKGGSYQPSDVTLGSVGLSNVVISKGISAGDVVALRDPRAEAALPGMAATTASRPGPGGLKP